MSVRTTLATTTLGFGAIAAALRLPPMLKYARGDVDSRCIYDPLYGLLDVSTWVTVATFVLALVTVVALRFEPESVVSEPANRRVWWFLAAGASMPVGAYLAWKAVYAAGKGWYYCR